MTNNYSSNLDFIAHAGRGHDDNPPGRGSGRYAWGSGAKWGKTSLGRSTNRVKGFFKKKKPVGNRVDVAPDSKPKEVSSQELKEQHEADRKAALESGDRNSILKYFQESSNEELQRAITKAGMMDSLNKSISDSKPKIQSPEDLAKTQKEEYIKAALASGDKKQIFSVASDPSVTNNDLVNALNKVNTIDNLNKQLNPSKFDKTVEFADKLKSVLDKGLGYYNTTSNVWNIIAANYNNSQAVKNNPTKALGYMMQISNLNLKKDVKKS